MKKIMSWVFLVILMSASFGTPLFAERKQEKDYRKKHGHGYHSQKSEKGHGRSDRKSRYAKKEIEDQKLEAEAAELYPDADKKY